MEKLFTALGATALLALALGLAAAPAGEVPWGGLLCAHFVNIWLWSAAYVFVSRRYREARQSENTGAASVLFLLSLLTIALFLSSLHEGLLLASEHGILLGNTVYHVARNHPLAMALSQILLGVGALAILVTMRRESNLATLIEESDAARTIRRLNTELSQEKQKLQTVVLGIRGGLAMLDVEDHILWHNDTYGAWFGRDSSLTGKDCRKVLGVVPADPNPWPHDRLRQSRENVAQSELMLTLASGSQRPFLVSAYTIAADDGSITGHLQLLQDISEQKQLQAQLLESEKLSAVGQLISSVAHELNNPLAILVGYSEMTVEEEDVPASVKQTMEMIRQNSTRCQRVVKNLLQFVRRYKVETCSKSIRDPMAAVLELKRYQLTVDNIEAVLDCPWDLPETMMDEHKMQQVFLNLVNNAHDAISEQRRPGHIWLSARVEDGWIVAQVADDGPGIPEVLRDKVMSPFFTTKAPGKGTGLGLAICKTIVEEMNGRFELDAQPGQRTTFTIRLPIVQVAQPLKKPDAIPATRSARIMVVDDEPEILKQLEKLLIEAGHTCIVESDATAAMGRLARGERYDLVLCDLKMPGMDGLEFLDRSQAQHGGAIGKFLFLSGDTANPRTRTWIDERGVQMIEKPYTRDEILGHVNRALAGTQSVN
ncbi:MAG: response regulator [Candidatus Riflebacteria bacterium]|nr:response regulator [Candidatus Riflebacteria bacterium]